MKLVLIAALALVAAASAAPQTSVPARVVQILRSVYDQQPNGGYNYAFETEDANKRDETGELKTVTDEENKQHEVVVVRGAYSYVDSDGNPHSVTYFADETGFHAESADIPQAPVARR